MRRVNFSRCDILVCSVCKCVHALRALAHAHSGAVLSLVSLAGFQQGRASLSCVACPGCVLARGTAILPVPASAKTWIQILALPCSMQEVKCTHSHAYRESTPSPSQLHAADSQHTARPDAGLPFPHLYILYASRQIPVTIPYEAPRCPKPTISILLTPQGEVPAKICNASNNF